MLTLNIEQNIPIRDLLVRPLTTVCQSDTSFSIYSRGRQCMTNCITFIMESCLIDVTTIGRTDMNMVSIAGDVLYKKLQKMVNLMSCFLICLNLLCVMAIASP